MIQTVFKFLRGLLYNWLRHNSSDQKIVGLEDCIVLNFKSFIGLWESSEPSMTPQIFTDATVHLLAVMGN